MKSNGTLYQWQITMSHNSRKKFCYFQNQLHFGRKKGDEIRIAPLQLSGIVVNKKVNKFTEVVFQR